MDGKEPLKTDLSLSESAQDRFFFRFRVLCNPTIFFRFHIFAYPCAFLHKKANAKNGKTSDFPKKTEFLPPGKAVGEKCRKPRCFRGFRKCGFIHFFPRSGSSSPPFARAVENAVETLWKAALFPQKSVLPDNGTFPGFPALFHRQTAKNNRFRMKVAETITTIRFVLDSAGISGPDFPTSHRFAPDFLQKTGYFPSGKPHLPHPKDVFVQLDHTRTVRPPMLKRNLPKGLDKGFSHAPEKEPVRGSEKRIRKIRLLLN